MQAATNIKSLLGLPTSTAVGASCTVQFGSNSHELVTRLLSALLLDRRSRQQGSAAASAAGQAAAGTTGEPTGMVRVLTTDTEFYSITRQLNRLAGRLGRAWCWAWGAPCRFTHLGVDWWWLPSWGFPCRTVRCSECSAVGASAGRLGWLGGRVRVCVRAWA